ncbi:hypothetical protein N7495_004757 [Penicillium taxi]|uniref:uncharacterized protein n=1 Tax=Penicillium taxi TaxID=168475 RepID=UPI0025452E9D|nr:uncharacterized protein N7495_004757 [Penicillium taxi]KAJ5900013.1 hypothetical protein N7495_004757 [Penicillium taxi]
MAEGTQGRGLFRRIVEAVLYRDQNEYPPFAAHAAATATQRNEPVNNDLSDAEKGKIRNLATSNPDAMIPSNDKLLIFRALTGIDSVPAITEGGHLLRSAPNIGIYTRVVQNEGKAARSFRLFNYLINICLGTQIVVAAALTAIGAASGPHSAIVVFGALNTIIAGLLTYFRGSGLPDRLKSYKNKWKNIREYIEQREREFCLVSCDLDVQEEVFIVESMYQSVKSEMETTKSSGEGHPQQPDDPRIRRSLLPTNNSLSGQRDHTTPAKRSDALSRQQLHDEKIGSAVPEPV